MLAPPNSRGRRALQVAAREAEALWVGGVVAVLLVVARQFLPDQKLHDLWIEYGLLGALMPVAVVGVLVAERRGPVPWLTAAKVVIALVGLAVALRYLVAGRSPYLLVVATAEVLVVVGLTRRDRRRHGETERASLPALLAVAIISWAAATQLIWWTPWDRFLGSTPFAIAVLAASLVLVAAVLHQRAPPSPARLLWPTRTLTAIGVLLLVVAAFRNDGLYDYAGFHHWSYYVGPAELVRQGHWLLWDVPAQYGFLSTAAIAAMPAGSVWESLFLLSSLLSAASAVIVLLAVRSLGRGPLNALLALCLALSVQFLRYYPGPPVFPGARVYPSTGGMRFIWLISLAAVVLQLMRSEGATRARWYAAGTTIWVIGVLWSFESAVYCSAVWLPVCLMLATGRARPEGGDRPSRQSIASGLRWGAAPLAALGASVLVICGYYVLRLGHVPDWHAFTEFVTAYQSGFFAAPMEFGGVVWVLVVLFCALSAGACIACRSFTIEAVVVWAAWASLLMTGSYFVGRSHASIVQVLSPVFVLSVVMVLAALRRRDATGRGSSLVRVSILPVLVMLLVSSFGDAGRLADYATGIHDETAHVTTVLPRVDPEAQGLLTVARVRSGDPITFVECFDFPARMPRWMAADGAVVSDPRSWLPADPYGELLPLSPSRLDAYLTRFAERAPSSGWVLVCKHTRAPLTVLTWVMRHYDATGVLESPSWLLTRFTRRTAA